MYEYDRSFSHWGPRYDGSLEHSYVARGFETDAGINERGRVVQRLAQRIALGTGRHRILDVGCFQGDYLRRISTVASPRRFEYVGVDVNESSIEAAQREFAGNKNARFEVGDIFNLGFEDEAFDSVICTDVIIHLPELQRPLSEVNRVTRDTLYLIMHLTRGDSGDHGYATPAGDGEDRFLDNYYNLPDLNAAFEQLDPRPRSVLYERYPKYSAKGELYADVEYAYFELRRGLAVAAARPVEDLRRVASMGFVRNLIVDARERLRGAGDRAARRLTGARRVAQPRVAPRPGRDG